MMEIMDFSLHVLLGLEIVFQEKIKSFDENAKGVSDSFSSLLNTMSDEQSEELKCLELTIFTISRVKQIICTHTKKDHDICDGVKYCMNCNLTL